MPFALALLPYCFNSPMKLDKSACSTTSLSCGRSRKGITQSWVKGLVVFQASWTVPCKHQGLFLCSLTEERNSLSLSKLHKASRTSQDSFTSVSIKWVQNTPVSWPVSIKGLQERVEELSNRVHESWLTWTLLQLSQEKLQLPLLLCIISHIFSVIFTGVPWALDTAIRGVSQTTGCHLVC